MKKGIACVSLFVFALVIGCSAASPEKKVLAVLEGYFHCIGNGELDELNKYATENAVEYAKVISAFGSEVQKEPLKNFKADEAQLELKDDRYFYGVTFFDIDTVEIINTGDEWKVNNFVAEPVAPQLSPTYDAHPFGKITDGEGTNEYE